MIHLNSDPTFLGDLRTRGLSESEAGFLLAQHVDGTSGWLLYGSRARNDWVESSDFDLIRLSAARSPLREFERVSVSSYSAVDLSQTSRTLFGTHLIRDGIVLWEDASSLSETLSRLEPASPIELLERVRKYTCAIAFDDRESSRHIGGLVYLARYLLRTAMYAREMLLGRTTFSVRELATRYADQRIAVLLSSKADTFPTPSLGLFRELRDRLSAIVGPIALQPGDTLEALSIRAWKDNQVLSALAIRAGLGDSGVTYVNLPRIAL